MKERIWVNDEKEQNSTDINTDSRRVRGGGLHGGRRSAVFSGAFCNAG